MNICKFSGPIAIKFNLKHHLGREKAAFVFGADRPRTLVFMGTDSSLTVIMGKTVLPLFLRYLSFDLFNIYR